ncbi:hypothetical protein AJ80_09729 [Polytolypa hystricis UAMH7299]|uniref:FAR1 domain-containing protein n=1 Tax=Polytolypa hystricis (strain UAMH7299) TaxID=1447883 RepID=A0A2B7WKQ5_POLH7|nr:hypothetical protein AJ80_09729 [Polytolypa hystricis UAMH7299]
MASSSAASDFGDPTEELNEISVTNPGRELQHEESHEESPEDAPRIPPPPERQFPTFSEAREYIDDWARMHGYAMVIRRSYKRPLKRLGLIEQTTYLMCDRGSENRRYSPGFKRVRTGSQKTDCPFSIKLSGRGAPDSLAGTFNMKILNPQHNHDATWDTSHPRYRHLTIKKAHDSLDRYLNGDLTAAQTINLIQQELSKLEPQPIEYRLLVREPQGILSHTQPAPAAASGRILSRWETMDRGVLEDVEGDVVELNR